MESMNMTTVYGSLFVGENDTTETGADVSGETGGPLKLLNVTLVNHLLNCDHWLASQHILFQMANICFCVSYLAPNGTYGVLFMHTLLIFGFLLFSTWAWNVICAPDVFSWNFSFVIINMFQMLYILYEMRPVRFASELEDVFQNVFEPLQISRQIFKRLISQEYAQILSLHTGEAYAMQNLTKTDRLGLLISGKVNVMTDNHFLHHIYAKQFLDSPEFESSRAGVEDKFKVTIIAATPCRYVFWLRESLEYLFVKDTYLAHVMSILIARDVTTKLYAMNEKIVTEKGSHLDIRLPSITSSIASYGQDVRSPSRFLRACKTNNHGQSNSIAHLPLPNNSANGSTVNHADSSDRITAYGSKEVTVSDVVVQGEDSRSGMESTQINGSYHSSYPPTTTAAALPPPPPPPSSSSSSSSSAITSASNGITDTNPDCALNANVVLASVIMTNLKLPSIQESIVT